MEERTGITTLNHARVRRLAARAKETEMQKVDDIKPCYPLFRQDEYKETLSNKKALFEEGHAADKVEETFQWTTTMEYRELNFKREALTVNPAKACQPLGAVLCSLGFEKTLPYVHGSQVAWPTSVPTSTVTSASPCPACPTP
jgi:hypothetical protein